MACDIGDAGTAALLQFGSEVDVAAFRDALESCVGRQWVEEGDPDEHYISFERLEVAGGEEAYGFRQKTEHGEADWLAFVPFDDVLLILGTSQDDVRVRFDEAAFDQLVSKAVARAADSGRPVKAARLRFYVQLPSPSPMTRIDVTKIDVKPHDIEQVRDARYEEMLAREYGWD